MTRVAWEVVHILLITGDFGSQFKLLMFPLEQMKKAEISQGYHDFIKS